MYQLFTSDLPCEGDDTIAISADDTAILALNENPQEATASLHQMNYRLKNVLATNQKTHLSLENKMLLYKVTIIIIIFR